MKKIILGIDGMSCSACSNGLEKYLNRQEGIESAVVNLVMATASICYDETRLDQKKIERFIKEAGFRSTGIYRVNAEKETHRKEKIMFFLFGFLALIILYLSMGTMFGLPVVEALHMHRNPKIYSSVLCVLSFLFLIYGFDIIKSGWNNLIHRTPNMDTLVMIGVISSFLYSVYHMVLIFYGEPTYVEHLYFESTAIVIFFIKLGRYIDAVNKNKTKEAIQKLVQITPTSAVIKRGTKEEKVTIDEVQPGDIVICKAGEKIAVDGTIVKGSAHIDESLITGESKPVAKSKDEKVIAGSINYDGYLEYRAEKIGKDSTISEIVRLVMEATNTKMPIAKLADRVSGYFVPVVILLAVITFIAYLILGYSMDEAVNTFVTILVVACPCALGLATPLAIVVSEGLCASRGILVKHSEILELSSKVDTIVFDKTGTLTYGRLRIVHFVNHSNIDEKTLMLWISSLELQSTHPIRGAFELYMKQNNLKPLDVTDFKNISGEGIRGTVNGKKMMLGNESLLQHYHLEHSCQKEIDQFSNEGNSIIFVVLEDSVVGLIGVNDVVREEAKAVIAQLHEKKVHTVLLTGDHKNVADKIGRKLKVETVVANVLPKEKLNYIDTLKKEGHIVMMCGDGINDSPALAHADVGLSMSGSTDIATDAADVILMKEDLNDILRLLDISKHTIRNIKQNLFWAFFYNVLMIPIAMGLFRDFGITLHPMLAGFAMMFSSFTVMLNALRLKTIR